MNVTIEQVQAGIIKYIDTDIAPRAQGFTKFMIYFAAPSIPKMVSQKLTELRATGMIEDLFDESGNINLEEAYKRASEAMKKSGKVLIKQLNYFADNEDLDRLYAHIKSS